MKMIRKELLFRTMIVSVSICLLVHDVGYAAICLRVPLIYGKMNGSQSPKRVQATTINIKHSIASDNKIKVKAKAILEGLRPDFHEKVLSAREFEESIRLKMIEEGFIYNHLESNAWNTIPINILGIINAAKNMDWSGLLIDILGLSTLVVHGRAGLLADTGYEKDKIQGVSILNTGKFGFITPLSFLCLLGLSMFFDVVPYHRILWWLILPTILNLSLYFYSSITLAHELQHAYIIFMVYKLEKEGLVDIAATELSNLKMGFDQGINITKGYIDIQSIDILEDRVLNALEDRFIKPPIAIIDDSQTFSSTEVVIISSERSPKHIIPLFHKLKQLLTSL